MATDADRVKAVLKDEYGALFILNRYEDGIKATRNLISDFWLNHSFLLGYQWTYVEAESGVVRDVANDDDREQVVINRMWPNSRVLIGKLTQREMTFENLPTAADDGSVRGARIGESIIRATKETHDWEGLREKASWACWKGGTCAISVDWDPDAGHVTVGPTDTSREARGGDTVEQVLTISEFVVEPGVRDGETARWWIKAEALPPEVAQSIYELEEAPGADMLAGTSGIQRRLVSSTGLATRTSSGADGNNLTLVLTYYERPNHLAPEGRISVVIDNKIVQGENPETGEKMSWPFPWDDHLNIAIIRETVMETEWAGRTVLSMARGVQSAFNAAWSNLLEHMKLAGNARLAVPESSIDAIEEFTDLPGEIISFPDGSTPPFYLQPAQLPAWLIDTPVNLALQMDDIMGVQDINRGVAPANIESGFGISILAEQSETPVGRLSKEIAKAFSKIASMCLQLFEAEVKSTRKTIVAEEGQPPSATTWVGKDLLGQTAIKVPYDSVVPRNRAAQLQLAKDLQAGGLITTLDEFITVAELADGNAILEKVDPDTARARRENHAFRAGKGAFVESFDNHKIHLKEHNILRKSRAWELMTEKEREVLDDHMEGHEVSAAEEAGKMQNSLAVGGSGLADAPTADEIPLPPEMAGMEQLGESMPPDIGGQAPPSGDSIPDAQLPPLI